MAALNSLASANPLTAQAVAIEAALRALFPAAKFDLVHLPAALTEKVWRAKLQRWPALAIQFSGLSVDSNSGRLPQCTAEWRVFVLTQNLAGERPRLLGDAAGPGLAGMVVLATLALHGLALADSGSATVSAADNLGGDFLDESVAAAGLALRFGPFGLVNTDAVGDLAEFLTHGPVWSFPDLAPPPFAVRP